MIGVRRTSSKSPSYPARVKDRPEVENSYGKPQIVDNDNDEKWKKTKHHHHHHHHRHHKHHHKHNKKKHRANNNVAGPRIAGIKAKRVVITSTEIQVQYLVMWETSRGKCQWISQKILENEHL